MVTQDDIQYIKQAIEESKQSRSEPDKVSPLVGAVVVKNGVVLAATHRGAQDPRDHAEFTALEKMLRDSVVAGSTVYTTLEPCTTRNHPKVSCAQRLIERKVARVVIGMLDPNPSICGKGWRLLRDHNIEVDSFPNDLAAEVEDLNRHFRRAIEEHVAKKEVDKAFIDRYQSRSLDDWYKATNYIYADRNFYRDSTSIFAHLVEVVGGLSQLASAKRKPGRSPEEFLPKAIAWWLALCGKVGVSSVSDLLWLKFPGVCPYCQKPECDPTFCKKKKRETAEPIWKELRTLGKRTTRPARFGEWQRMFRSIYKPGSKPDFETPFARLSEELGELAEAVRVFPANPGYFLSEAADVFAWLMNIQNNIDFRDELDEPSYGKRLETSFCTAYPDYCVDCTKSRCICPPILESTIGRTAHELPLDTDLFDRGAIFMTSDRARSVFTAPT